MSLPLCRDAALATVLQPRYSGANTDTYPNNVLLRGRVAGLGTPYPAAVGFVWSTTVAAPTLRDCDGATRPQYVLGVSPVVPVTFTALTGQLAPATYTVRAYVQWPAGRGAVVYSPPGTTFAVVDSAAVYMDGVGDTFPWLSFRGEFDGDADVFGQVGFVWAASVQDLTREAALGDSGPQATAPGFSFNYDTTPLAPGTYYVTPYALSTLPGQPVRTIYGATPAVFYAGPQAPVVATEQAFQTVDASNPGQLLVHMQMRLISSQPSFVPDTAVYAFLYSTTNPVPAPGGGDVQQVLPTRVPPSLFVDAIVPVTAAEANTIRYVRAAAGLVDPTAALAATVLVTQRAPTVTAELISQAGPSVVFSGTASYDGFPDGGAPGSSVLARAQISRAGFVWAKGREPTLDDFDGGDTVTQVPTEGLQPPDFVPVVGDLITAFELGPGVYNTRAYVLLVNSTGFSEQQPVYSATVAVIV
jgi:hypothetical protein